MPSASAKIEKTPSVEANDAGKQFVNMLEKRMRNLEKRKMKLDNYRSDVEKGKELNEDQKMAVSKYESVLSNLDFAKDLYKSALTVYQENSRQQKKQAKKEQIERQQYEIQRLQEAFIYCNLLSCFQNEDVRNDFLNGENGAIKLTNEQLSQLDSLYKLIGPGLPNEQADITSYFHALAENHIFLVEGRNKEIVGTTYKVLKEILQSIRESGYFSKPSEQVEDVVSSDDMPEEDTVEKPDEPQEYVGQSNSFEAAQDQEKYEAPETHQEQSTSPLPESVVPEPVSIVQNGPLQEVLSTQGTFNFLQESQIDLGAPHMDPAVVAVHQMAPPPTVNFGINSYSSSPPVEESAQPMVNGNGTTNPRELSASPSAVNQVPVMSGGMPRSVAPQIVQHGAQHDFDPSHPIPTQTFTNQSFAVMQNMIMPQAYVPVTMHHAPLPPHMAPIAVVPAPPAVSSALPVPVQSLPEEIPLAINPEQGEVLPNGDGAPESDSNVNESPVEKSENNANGHYRGGYRGRGRGRGNNGYYRGRSSYHNGHNNGRGGYQNHYYQDRDRNGYNNNYNRRGNNNNNRGPRGNGNYRGRGNFNRPQGPQQQQQQAPQQETQQ